MHPTVETLQEFSDGLDQDFPGFFIFRIDGIEEVLIPLAVRYLLWCDVLGWFEVGYVPEVGDEADVPWTEFELRLATSLGGPLADVISRQVTVEFQAWLQAQPKPFLSASTLISFGEHGLHLLQGSV